MYNAIRKNVFVVVAAITVNGSSPLPPVNPTYTAPQIYKQKKKSILARDVHTQARKVTDKSAQ